MDTYLYIRVQLGQHDPFLNLMHRRVWIALSWFALPSSNGVGMVNCHIRNCVSSFLRLHKGCLNVELYTRHSTNLTITEAVQSTSGLGRQLNLVLSLLAHLHRIILSMCDTGPATSTLNS